MAGSSSQETEIKLRVESAQWARRLLENAGFALRAERTFESNSLYDRADSQLRKQRQVLRIRQAGGRAILTYKGAPLEARHKVREELELEVSSAATMEDILHRLGYERIFLYEKYRAEYHRSGEAGVATVDETPMGAFIELEGPEYWIDGVAGQLGFSAADYIKDSYVALWLALCKQQGEAVSDMVFSSTRRH